MVKLMSWFVFNLELLLFYHSSSPLLCLITDYLVVQFYLRSNGNSFILFMFHVLLSFLDFLLTMEYKCSQIVCGISFEYLPILHYIMN
jgi:hypothetical protein